MEKINKPSIVITSLGRTGTKFFAAYFRATTKNATVFHEPGMFNYKKMDPKQIANAIKVRGFNDAVLKKLLNRPELKKISKWRFENRISREKAVEMILKERKRFIESFSTPSYIESNYMYQGLIDVIPGAFSKVRILWIVRDPRDWVRSFINWRGLYHWTDIQLILGNRITPRTVKDEEYIDRYPKMSQFEKLCWVWNYINRRAILDAKKTPEAYWSKFESIFKEKNNNEHVQKLVSFLVGGESPFVELVSDFEAVSNNMLKKKIHKPDEYFFSRWPDWTKKDARILNNYCGSFMQDLGYGNEPEWQDLIG